MVFRHSLGYLGLLAFLVLLEMRFIVVFHEGNILEWLQASSGVVTGRPHWRAYQNRLLGPYLIAGLNYFLGSLWSSYLWFAGVMLMTTKVVWFGIVSRLTQDKTLAFTYTVFFSAMFLFLQDRSWLYPWDFIDLVVFSVFVFFIYMRAPLGHFVVLFLVELLNRESALFIALWLMIDSLCIQESLATTFRKLTVDRKKFAVGLGLFLFGAAFTKLVRDALFVSSHFMWVGTDEAHRLLGNHVYFFRNLQDLWRYNLRSADLNIVVTVFLVLMVVLLVIRFRWDELRVKTTILFAAILSNIFVFGLINETRMFFITIPFLLMFVLEHIGAIRQP